jgi:poly(A) polymerase
MRIGEYRSEWKDSAVKRLMRDAGADIADLVTLAKADRRGSGPHASVKEIDELQERMESVLLQTPVQELESPLNGREIMQLLGIPPGPKVREAKEFLVEQVLEGHLPPGDKAAARALLLSYFGRPGECDG